MSSRLANNKDFVVFKLCDSCTCLLCGSGVSLFFSCKHGSFVFFCRILFFVWLDPRSSQTLKQNARKSSYQGCCYVSRGRVVWCSAPRFFTAHLFLELHSVARFVTRQLKHCGLSFTSLAVWSDDNVRNLTKSYVVLLVILWKQVIPYYELVVKLLVCNISRITCQVS